MTTTTARRAIVCASLSPADLARFEGGPRCDMVEVARASGARLLSASGRRRRGLLGRVLGPHVAHAWRTAGEVRNGDAVFADGEHVGLPLLAFLRLRRRRPGRVVMLAHLPGRWWKRLLFRALARGDLRGTVLTHSVEQARGVRGSVGPGWRVRAVPYQVDESFWCAAEAPPPAMPPLVVAVGAEFRDYATLLEAARGVEAEFVVAAGSHWARQAARAGGAAGRVRFIDEPLGYRDLRELYRRASAVVVPLADAPNQAGITTILEAMSMGRPVVVTATRGQRECVRGPLVRADGSFDAAATADRGPRMFEDCAAADCCAGAAPTGLYVPPGDATALGAALRRVLDDAALSEDLGRAARASVERHFTLDRFVARIQRELREAGP